MTKHNKKRNIGLIYELFLKHISECLISERVSDLKKATSILEKRFAKGTELYKEFRLFNALAQTTASDTHIVASILTEAKSAARNCNINKLNKEKTKLIHDINYKINDPKFYYRNISNYRDLATIQLMINEWRKEDDCNLQKLVEYEQKVTGCLLREKKKETLAEAKKNLDASDSDKLVLKIMTEKINKKYGSNLSHEEKEIIRNYALYSNSNEKRLKEYLANKKTKSLQLLESFEDVEKNKFLISKVDKVRNKINDLKVETINDTSIVKFLTLTKLINELKKPGK